MSCKYKKIEKYDVLMAEHELIGNNSAYNKDPEYAVKISMFNEGVNAMAAAMLELFDKEDNE